MGYWLEALGRFPSYFMFTDMKGKVCSPEFWIFKSCLNHMLVCSFEAQIEVPVGEDSFYHT